MGVMDKFLNYMKLNDEDEFDDDYLDDEEDEIAPPPRKAAPIKKEKEEEPDDRISKRGSVQPKVTPIRQNNVRRLQGSGMEVCVIRPSSIDDEREITDTLLDGRTVVLNVEGLAVDIAQRIIDFTSGSCYAMGGNLQKISNYIFIITPANVEISGDFQSYVDGFDANSFKSEF